MHDADATLATFTTDLVARLCEQPTDSTAPPIIETSGALLQVDIVGSALLAEKIRARSPHNAADEFVTVLNGCFDSIISSIHACGGEIVDFAGDSVLSIW